MRTSPAALAAALIGASTAILHGQEAPLSAIPWLSDSIATPRAAGETLDAPRTVSDAITTLPLGATRRDAVGLTSAERAGVPRDAVAGSDPADLARLYAAIPTDALPAVQAVVMRLLLAELDPPRAAVDPDALFFARVDALLRLGALDQAQALLERAGATDKTAFRRWFDVSLLTGYDTRACDAMTANPGVAPTLPARIFCLSRTGDWAAAALTLETGRALGHISDADDLLLAHFLDPELFEGEPPPEPQEPMTPLAFRLLDGIGETPDTPALPLAFAAADLRPTTGWKAQIEAAERLVRAGALDANRLLSLYTERRPAASGGVWDRATAIQALDTALLGGRVEAVADALPDAFARMRQARLVVPFAQLYGARLMRLGLPGEAGVLADRLGLLSDAPARLAMGVAPDGPLAFAAAIARGEVPPPTTDPIAQAVADGFTAPPAEDAMRLAGEGRLAEALLRALAPMARGRDADPRAVTEGLALLQATGFEEAARRLALQILLA